MMTSCGEYRLYRHFKVLVVMGVSVAALLYWLSVLSYAQKLETRLKDNSLKASGRRVAVLKDHEPPFNQEITLFSRSLLRKQYNLSSTETPATSQKLFPPSAVHSAGRTKLPHDPSLAISPASTKLLHHTTQV